MKKISILFVTNSNPFPPKNGMELPIANIATEMGKKYTVDILICTTQDQIDSNNGNVNYSSTIRNLFYLPVKKKPAFNRLLSEWIGISPSFFSDIYNTYESKKIINNRKYDFVWVSPFRCISFIRFCEKNNIELTNNCAVGLNDVKSYMYLDSLKEFISGRLGFDVKRLYRGIRFPLMRMYEKRYLKKCNLVHVQTLQEYSRARKILGQNINPPYIIAAQNGKNQQLEKASYKGVDSKAVLYMTHFAGGRETESRWFLSKVWPIVINKKPDIKLMLVGTPPNPGSAINKIIPRSAEVIGYAEDLSKLYNSVAISVVPTLHSTGLSNRIQDALVAGVPVVTTPEAMSTIDNINESKGVMSAMDADQYAEKIIELMSDKDLRIKQSELARQYSKSINSWVDTSRSIMKTVEKILKQ